MRRRLLAVGAAVLLVAVTVVALGPTPPAVAANTAPFTAAFRANANGAIVTVGNNLLTCPAGASSGGVSCANARAGGVADDNGFTMTNLDADSDATTFNSSMSQLNLPAGSSVLWAGLVWGARLDAGSGGRAGTGTRTQMQLQVPGATNYQTISSSQEFGPNTTSNNAYQEFANITSQVQAAGSGAYWGANVVAGTGQDRYAGWAMTVVYTAPGLPLRNLTVFNGFNVVGAGTPQNVTVSGFQAPLSGTVDAQLTMVAYEGDLSQTGDYTRLNNTQLATALSPGSNFFDSTNDLNGASVTTRSPADKNMLGFDIKNLGASGAIANGATSATFTFSSNGDVYYPGVVGLAINLYAPDFSASSKTVVDLNGNTPARPGDTLQYTLNYVNTGQDPAVNVVSTDPLPANTTYVPGSLNLVNPLTGANSPVTDAAGDDVGEYAAASRTVRVRLGSSAGAATNAGGRMACSGTGCTDDGTSRASYTFQVTLDTAAGGTTVTNLANLAYTTATTGIAATYTTNPATEDVITQADVSITKVMTPNPTTVGDQTTGTITISNNGPNTAQDVTMRDPIIDGWINDSVDTPAGVTCTVDTVINCSLGNVPVGASVVIVAHGHMLSSTTTPTLTNVAYANTTSYDPNLNNNVASDTINLIRTADLSITKTASPSSSAPGSTVSYTLSVTNQGPSDAQNVLISDTVANSSQLSLGSVTGTTGGASCTAPQGGSLRCTAATLTAGATATVTVTGVLASNLASGVNVGNTATVTSGTADTNSANNTATAQVTTTARTSDVRLTKTGPATVVAGSTVSYTIVATNNGPSDATNVVVTDPAPAGITWTAVNTSRGTCQPPAATTSCVVGGLPAGTSATITVTGTLAADAPTGTGALSNTATVTSNGPTQTATATSDVARSFDLAVAKTANRASLPGVGGRQVIYTITVSNNGPSTASGVVVSDLVPLGLNFQSATPQSGTCDTSQANTPQPGDAAHGLVTCALATPIPVGGSQTITVTMVSPGDVSGGPALSETVTVTAPGDDQSRLANNTATWTLSGLPYSDLSLTKTGPATVIAGSTGTYSFGVLNTPPDPDEEQLTALAPTITDTLPAGVTFIPAGAPGSVTPAYCTAAGQDVTCVLPDSIAPNATESTQFSVQFAPGLADGTAITNTAVVHNQLSNPDPNPANNTSSATTTVTTDADVAVTGMSITPEDPAATGPGTWIDVAFTLTNNGPSTARGVQFTTRIDVPAGIDPSSVPSDCTITTGSLTCTIDGEDLTPGQSVTISFRAALPGNVTPGSYGAQTHVSSATPDSNLTNNDASTTFTVGAARTDLHISKSAIDTIPNPNGDGHPAYVAGKPFAYQITLSVPNAAGDGVADAANVQLADTMPAGFQATLVSTTAGTCTVNGPGTRFTCRLGTIAAWPGDTEPVTVTIYGFVDVAADGEQIPNTATATSATADQDGNPTSVSATASVDVIEQADLQLFKVADPGPFHAGGQIGYTLTTVNAGPSDVEDATITDTLPAGLTLDASNSPNCTVTSGDPATGQQVSCTVGAITVGTSVSVRLVADSLPDATPGPITNTATVTSSATDPIPANNSASATVTLDQLADVAISSAVSTTTPAAGGQITYTAYTINNGPSAAFDVTADTTFPAGFVPVSADVPFNTCSWNPPAPSNPAAVGWQNISYTLHCAPTNPNAPFEPGVATTSVVVMQIPGDTPAGDYSGSSTITTTTPESTTANNATGQSVSVQRVSNVSLTKTLVDPNPMLSGRPATWRLTVTNAGPSVADNVVISDTVPAGMTFTSANLEGGSACPAPEIHDTDVIVKCPIAALGVGDSASALVTFAIDTGTGGQQLCNTALVGSGSLDPDATDNQAQNCNQAATPPATDVGLTITAQHPTLRPGQHAQFTATVTNNGDQSATGVKITFPVPAGLTDPAGILLTASDGTTPEATCVIDDIVCTIGDLQPGQQVSYTITGIAAGTAGSLITLTGTATHNEPDTDPANNTSRASTNITGPPASTNPSSPATGGPTPSTPQTGTPASPKGDHSNTGSSSGLPFTGADSRTPLILGLLALSAGLVLIVAGRRRTGHPATARIRPRHRD
jgi:uncharacterized repeat protein (TIGR01451 family)/fimbrial isopeptide formation D2 family protein